jgi:hypothetical protein
VRISYWLPGAYTSETPGPGASAFVRITASPTQSGPARGVPRQSTRDARDRVVNSAAYRAPEVPAVNGHGTARSIARFYGGLAGGGELDGVKLLDTGQVDVTLAA